MKDNQVSPSRPPTVWVDQSAFFQEHPSSKPIASPDIQPSPSQKMTAAAIALSLKKSLPDRPKRKIPQLNQNPWDTFEPVAASSQDRSLIFARHKTMKGELVHIQELKQQFSPATGSRTDGTNLSSKFLEANRELPSGCILHVGLGANGSVSQPHFSLQLLNYQR
jgi:hypothetical protein